MKNVKLLLVGLIVSFSSNAFIIESCADLESIGKGESYPNATHTDAWPLDGTYELIRDIDCGGREFDQIAPTEAEPFTGKLIGNSFTVSNVTGDKGLFGYVSFANINGLRLYNFVLNANRNYVGLLFDVGEFPALVDIYIDESEITNSLDYSGLIGGSIISDSGMGMVRDLVADHSSVSGVNYVGGIFGQSSGLTNYLYANWVTVNGTNYVGGISGDHDASDYIGHLSSRNSTISGVDFVGGIFGRFGYNIADGMNIVESDRNTITGSSYVGGIAGWSSTFSNSQVYSTSTIISSNGDFIGGLYGKLVDYYSPHAVYFSGNLTAGSTAQHVGRIVGEGENVNNVSNTYYYDAQEWISPVDNRIGEQPATYENLSNKDWYINTLDFDTNIWTFLNPLDPSHGPWMIR